MSVRPVIEQLQHMNGLHQQLLQLGKAKRQVLINNDIDRLSKVVSAETKLAKTIADSERKWIEEAKSYFSLNGRTPEPELTVSDLVELVKDEREKRELEQARSELMVTMHELKQMNALNQQLIEQSLAFVDYTIEMITGAPEELTYRNPNDHRVPEGRSLFDRKT